MLNEKISVIKNVGTNRQKLFTKLGIFTVGDMLGFFPRTYEDRSEVKSICDIEGGESGVCFKARACTVLNNRRVRKGLSYQKLTVTDGTGNIFITWFNHDWLFKDFDLNAEYTYFGKPAVSGGRLCVSNPVIVKDNKIEPVYPLTAGLTQNVFRAVMENCVPYANLAAESLPSEIREQHTLCGIEYALSNIHFPESFEKFEYARRRLAFEELLLFQLGLRLVKRRNEAFNGVPLQSSRTDEFIKGLPFSLTGAQKRATDEILADMNSNRVMNRLLQGDVGSGKTVVAAIAMLAAAETAQAAMMVPTSILAEQHYESISKILGDVGVTVALITGGMTAAQKKVVRERISSGEAQVVIGTHALIQEGVNFQNLRLVITDEQHRFGVRQRELLSQKGKDAHTLVMTATPIPRTLSLLLYGDLHLSIIDELPPGRKKIDTFTVGEQMRSRINNFMKEQITQGRQVYVVCPLIEQSEVSELTAANEYAEKLKSGALKGYNIGLMHGKLKEAEKDEIMRAFARGEIDVLVSTTVIEVGVNVPNASLMIIENAERFGLSQLHQLRGRVGRGEHKSYCVMFCEAAGEVTRGRMEIMCKTNDGFKIAEKDLELRGPGEFFGTRQHGVPELRIANLYSDMPLVTESGRVVDEILAEDSRLETKKYALLRTAVERMFK